MRLLDHLWKHSDPPDEEALGIEATVNALYPSKAVQAKLADPKVTVRVTRLQLRDVLERFALSTEGRKLPLRVSLPDGASPLRFEAQEPQAKKLWKPYLDSGRGVLIAYPELLFFRESAKGSHPGRFFVRHMDVNEGTGAELAKHYPVSKGAEFRPTRLFVAAGDMRAVLHFTKWFERCGLETEHAAVYPGAMWNTGQRANLLLFGTVRSFPELADILTQEKFSFEIQADRIVDHQPFGKDAATLPDDAVVPGVARGLMCRALSKEYGCWITVFASNHGRFYEGMISYLQSEQKLEELFNVLGADDATDPPEHFEVLFEVGLGENDQAKAKYGVRVVRAKVNGRDTRANKGGTREEQEK